MIPLSYLCIYVFPQPLKLRPRPLCLLTHSSCALLFTKSIDYKLRATKYKRRGFPSFIFWPLGGDWLLLLPCSQKVMDSTLVVTDDPDTVWSQNILSELIALSESCGPMMEWCVAPSAVDLQH